MPTTGHGKYLNETLADIRRIHEGLKLGNYFNGERFKFHSTPIICGSFIRNCILGGCELTARNILTEYILSYRYEDTVDVIFDGPPISLDMFCKIEGLLRRMEDVYIEDTSKYPLEVGFIVIHMRHDVKYTLTSAS